MVGVLSRESRPAGRSVPPVEGQVHPAFAEVAAYFRRLFRRDGVGGGSLCVFHRGEPVVNVWGGYADEKRAQPWRENTLGITFSATKGIASTVIHRLADRGLLAYDRPVAEYWPAFGAAGKQHLTVAQLMSHQGGLHNVERLVQKDAVEILDHEEMERRLAAAEPQYVPGHPGYHAITYGWLAAGLARSITGKGMAELVRQEITSPLGIADDMSIGMPTSGPDRIAMPLLGPIYQLSGIGVRVGPYAGRWARIGRPYSAFVAPGIHEMFRDDPMSMLRTEMPAANGLMTARALARMYSAIAQSAAGDGEGFLSADTVRSMGTQQISATDYILGFNLRWRIGYHMVPSLSSPVRRAFGHFGLGGSGGWVDPLSGVAVGFVTNRPGPAGMAVGDQRLFRISGLALKAARRRTLS